MSDSEEPASCANLAALGFIDLVEQLIDTGWVSVSEQLPEKSGRYLVYIPTSYGVEIENFNIEQHWINVKHGHRVIFWRELPPPPHKKGG